jgi:hypothetical protein
VRQPVTANFRLQGTYVLVNNDEVKAGGQASTMIAPIGANADQVRMVRALPVGNAVQFEAILWSRDDRECTWRLTSSDHVLKVTVPAGSKEEVALTVGGSGAVEVEVSGGSRPESCLMINPAFGTPEVDSPAPPRSVPPSAPARPASRSPAPKDGLATRAS